MSELFFCLKTFVLTIAIVLALQLQVGERTLESHAMMFMQSSAVVTPLNNVARGAAKMFEDLKEKARKQAGYYQQKFSNNF
jgi:hypothetical protein